jgi:chorismate dehydratase
MDHPDADAGEKGNRIYRLGSVPYLNARPLVATAIDECAFAVPSKLADEFSRGLYDAALLPAFEAVRGSGATVADGICIGSDGPVHSVFLAHREPLDSITSVALDAASRTSSHLLQIILQDFYAMDVEYSDTPLSEDQARLIIGDPAIQFRREHQDGDWNFLDLGEAWNRTTGLPFAFAIWVIHPSAKHPEALADHLRKMKKTGLAMRDAIAAAEPDPEFARNYLTQSIRFDLDASGKEALRLYAVLLRKTGLVPATPENTLRFL